MMFTHRLLQRQIRKHLGPDPVIPEQWQAMLHAVEEAYGQFDSDRKLAERAPENPDAAPLGTPGEKDVDETSPAALQWELDEHPEQIVTDRLAGLERELRSVRSAGAGVKRPAARLRAARLHPSISGSDRAKSPADTARSLSAAFGKRVIFFKPSEPIPEMALTSETTANTIAVNVEAKEPFHVLIGHELTHNLKAQRPDLFARLQAVMNEMAPMPADYAETKREAYPAPGKADEEWIGDVLGERMDEPEFWREFAAAAQKLGGGQQAGKVRELAAYMNGWLDKIIRRAKNFLYGTHPFIAQMEALRKATAQIMAEYGAKADTYPENPGFANGEGVAGPA